MGWVGIGLDRKVVDVSVNICRGDVTVVESFYKH